MTMTRIKINNKFIPLEVYFTLSVTQIEIISFKEKFTYNTLLVSDYNIDENNKLHIEKSDLYEVTITDYVNTVNVTVADNIEITEFTDEGDVYYRIIIKYPTEL